MSFSWTCDEMENRLHVSCHLHWLLCENFSGFKSLITLSPHSLEPNEGMKQLGWEAQSRWDIFFRTCSKMKVRLHVSSHLLCSSCECFSGFKSLITFSPHSLKPSDGLKQLSEEVLVRKWIFFSNLFREMENRLYVSSQLLWHFYECSSGFKLLITLSFLTLWNQIED